MPPAPRRLLTLAALVPALACNGRGDGTGSTSGATTSGATSATSSSTTLDTSSGSGQTSAATSTGATESTGQATASTTDTTAGVKFDLPVPDGGGVDTDTDTGDVDESTCEAAAMSLTSAGCLFAPRCPHATARCRAEVPPMQEYLPGHGAACWEAGAFLEAGRPKPEAA